MNLKAVRTAVAKAKKKIAMETLKKQGVPVFVDTEGKLRALGRVYLKPGQEWTAEDEEYYSNVAELCEKAGVEFDLCVFVDDLGDEEGSLQR